MKFVPVILVIVAAAVIIDHAVSKGKRVRLATPFGSLDFNHVNGPKQLNESV